MSLTSKRCGAKTRTSKDGTYECKMYPIAGGTRCIKHGAGTRHAKAKAAERLALVKAHRYLQALGAAEIPHRDSIEALQDIGNQASLLVDLLRGVIAQLDTVSADGGAGVGEQIRGEVQAYLQAMTRAESVHGRILSLKLEERRTDIEERKALFIVAAVQAALELADGLTNRDVVVHELAKRLRLDPEEPKQLPRRIQ
jgi:hypothetical protein